MRLLAYLCLAWLAACMSPAPRDAALSRPEPPAADTLPPAALKDVAPDPVMRGFVRRVDQRQAALTGRPLVGGNRATLLVDGPQAHRSQLEAIAGARHHVHLMTYIMTDDAIGQRYRDALRDCVARGVEVRVMFDAIGSRGAGEPFRQQLTTAGVELHAYAPKREFWRVSRRNHRKILVVDGRVAFTGGISISDDYRRSAGVQIAGASQGSEQGWRDTHVRIEGPAVRQFQQLFIGQWQRESGGDIDEHSGYYPDVRQAGDDYVLLAVNKGENLPVAGPEAAANGSAEERSAANEIYGSYLAAMAESHSRIWITQAYFAPDDRFLETLTHAARRGVDVRMIVPGNSDVGLLLHASRHYYSGLLEAGARLFEYQGPVLHAKTAVIDSIWTTVGSSNLDYRSLVHNDEANAVIVSRAFAREMEKMFQEDQQRAAEIVRETWRERPWLDRLRERLAITLKYWI